MRPKAKKRPNRTAMTREADRLISKQVRARGHCELWILAPEVRCLGNLQACHIIGRRYRSTRWDEENLWAGCLAHHMHFTHHPEAFYIAIEDTYPGLYRRLYERAQKPWDKDLTAVLDRLRASDEVLG